MQKKVPAKERTELKYSEGAISEAFLKQSHESIEHAVMILPLQYSSCGSFWCTSNCAISRNSGVLIYFLDNRLPPLPKLK
jgi:hypothetical protein